MRASFTVADRYRVDCEWSAFGLERYCVDGKEVLCLRSLRTRGSRRFTAGEGDDLHKVRIELDLNISLNSIVDPCNWTAQAYVDDVLVVDDLTPTSRHWLSLINKISNWALLVSFAFLAIALIVLIIVSFVVQ